MNQFIKFRPENGMEVICCGQVSVYEKQGVYQLNVRYIEPKGVGAQALALEQLKERLLAEGLFAQERKRPLPFLPQKIGVVTSPSGAAIRDTPIPVPKVIPKAGNGISSLINCCQ